MNIAANLQKIRKKKNLTQAELASKVGMKTGSISNYENGVSEPSYEILEKIIKILGVSSDELLFGRTHQTGSGILTVTVDSHGRENCVLVPVKARAGYLSGYDDPGFISKLPAYNLPGANNKSYRLFEIGGYSMYDTFAPGDVVASSWVEQLADIRDGRVYVFVCDKKKTGDEGIVIKRAINRISKYGNLILKSDNIQEHYPDIILQPEDIYEVWYVDFFLSYNMRDPRNVYDRINDLEAKVALLGKHLPLLGD